MHFYLGSAILETMVTYRTLLNEWISSRGVFSEFWEPCVYLTLEGSSNFTCVKDGSVPTLLIIRYQSIVIGGYMNAANQGIPFALS